MAGSEPRFVLGSGPHIAVGSETCFEPCFALGFGPRFAAGLWPYLAVGSGLCITASTESCRAVGSKPRFALGFEPRFVAGL